MPFFTAIYEPHSSPTSPSRFLSSIFPQQRLLNLIPSWAGEWSTKKSGTSGVFMKLFVLENNLSNISLDTFVTYITSHHIMERISIRICQARFLNDNFAFGVYGATKSRYGDVFK